MKSVMLSIKPKWCEMIASGRKTIEVRKTRPKIETPFKCYIYQTFDGRTNSIDIFENNLGKVIGEFVCDAIITDRTLGHDGLFYGAACMTAAEVAAYATSTVYGWHISDLVIYDEPRELSEFLRINRECWYADLGLAKRDCPECKNAECFVSRPPQSWCYVEAV